MGDRYKTIATNYGAGIDISSGISYNASDDIATKLAILNPFRYRSYSDPESIHGLNLYAYCGNNPIMAVDPSGGAFLLFLVAVAIGFCCFICFVCCISSYI